MAKTVYIETTIPGAYFDERGCVVRLGLLTPMILTPQMLVEEAAGE